MLSGTMLLRAVVLLLLAVCLPPAALAQTPASTTSRGARRQGRSASPSPASSTATSRASCGGYRGARADMELVGMSEPDAALREAFRERTRSPEDRILRVAATNCCSGAKPEAIVAFSSTRDHRAIVEAAAARGIP